MIQVSDDFVSRMREVDSAPSIRVTIGEGNPATVLGPSDVQSATVTYRDDGQFSIGGTDSAMLSLVVFSDSLPSLFVTETIKVEIGYPPAERTWSEIDSEWVNASSVWDTSKDPSLYEWCEMGRFATSDALVGETGLFTTIQAYDSFYWMTASANQNSTAIDGTSSVSARSAVKALMGDSVDESTVPDSSFLTVRPSGLLRDQIGAWATVTFRNAAFRAEKLVFCGIEDTGLTILPSDYETGSYSITSGESVDIDHVSASITETHVIAEIPDVETETDDDGEDITDYSQDEQEDEEIALSSPDDTTGYAMQLDGAMFAGGVVNDDAQAVLAGVSTDLSTIAGLAGFPIDVLGFSVALRGFPQLRPYDKMTLQSPYGKSHEVIAISVSVTYNGSVKTTIGATAAQDSQPVSASPVATLANAVAVLDSKNASYHDLAVTNLTANKAQIKTLKSDLVETNELVAKKASIDDLNAANANIENLKANKADVSVLEAGYAKIDLANVNNAWIENGVVKDAAISDAMISDVSANKLTAGEIDASKITVSNLNASNISTGKLTVGGMTIDVENNEAEIDGSDVKDGTITLNGLAQEVKDEIDGAIETWTVTTVPTLNNSPASDWADDAAKKKHVGDVAYVVNADDSADGYCYRFAQDSDGNYSWALIKDSDVTKALQELIDAQGDITSLQSFQSDTESWETDTDEELSSLKTSATNLASRMDTAEGALSTKVDTSAFNEIKQTVDENSSSITSLTDTMETKADGSTVETLTDTVSSVKQTADSNTETIKSVSEEIASKADEETVSSLSMTVNYMRRDLDGMRSSVVGLAKSYDSIDSETVTVFCLTDSDTAPDAPTEEVTIADDVAGQWTLSRPSTTEDDQYLWFATQGKSVVYPDFASSESDFSSQDDWNATQTETMFGDVRHDFDAHSTRTDIIQTKEAITLKASQQDVSDAREAAIEVAANAIRSWVESAGGSTSYTQTDSGFTWSTTTDVNGIDSDARLGAAAAKSTADDASSAASSAQAAADGAATTAATAQSTAEEAKKTATNYMALVGDGLRMAKSDPATATSYTQMGDDSFEVVRDGTTVASFGETTTIGDVSKAHVGITGDGIYQTATDGTVIMDTTDEHVNRDGGTTADWFDATANYSSDSNLSHETVDGIVHNIYTIPASLPSGTVITVYDLENASGNTALDVAVLGTFTSGTASSLTASSMKTRYDYDGANAITYYCTSTDGSDICKFEWSYEEHLLCASLPEGAMLEGAWYMDVIHPVGSIYLSVDDTDPGTLFPHTYWTRVAQGRMLVGSSADPATSDYAANSSDSWGSLGLGTQKPPLTGMTGGSLKLTERELPAHTHGTGSSSFTSFITTNPDGDIVRYTTSYVSSGTQHANSVHSPNSANNDRTATGSAGSGGNYLPAFLAVAIWQRTA